MIKINLAVGVAATLIAISGAYASQVFSPEPVYISAMVEPNTQWTCVPCDNITCESTGVLSCTILVTTWSGGRSANARKIGPGWWDCYMSLPNYQNNPQNCSAYVFDVQ
jgi:hypothetical protein